MNSLDHGQIISMPCKVFLADPDTRTAGTICPDMCLATLGVAGILFVFFDSFTGPSLTVETFSKWWMNRTSALNFKIDKI